MYCVPALNKDLFQLHLVDYVSFYHVNDVSVYLGKQRGEGSPVERTSLRSFLVVSVPSAGVLNVHKVRNVSLLVQNEERVHEMHSFNQAWE